MKDRILFVGNFLSRSRGSKSITETIVSSLSNKYTITTTSNKSNHFIRLLDMVLAITLKKYEYVHIDIFSGRALIYANIISYIAAFKNISIVMTLRGGKIHGLLICILRQISLKPLILKNS